MTLKSEVHFEMLHLQVASIFKYYNTAAKDRWEMEHYTPLTIENNINVSYKLELKADSISRKCLSINVVVEGRTFTFSQNYNYGVPLDNSVTYLPVNVNKDLIDLEYALSIATEHTAHQIAKFKG